MRKCVAQPTTLTAPNKHAELGRKSWSIAADTMRPLFCEVFKGGLKWAVIVALSKHVTHCSPWSGFPCYILTPLLHWEDSPYPPHGRAGYLAKKINVKCRMSNFFASTLKHVYLLLWIQFILAETILCSSIFYSNLGHHPLPPPPPPPHQFLYLTVV